MDSLLLKMGMKQAQKMHQGSVLTRIYLNNTSRSSRTNSLKFKTFYEEIKSKFKNPPFPQKGQICVKRTPTARVKAIVAI
jgi:hypothetical protein